MPKKTPAPLPATLRHLGPFVRSLVKLRPEELNEDLDPSLLDAALRKRLRGLDEVASRAELAKDRELLEAWLTTVPPDHPAHWVLGYLSFPDLATHLTRPPQAPPRGPVISFEPPPGWKVKAVPFRLDLKMGKLIGSITAAEEFAFNLLQRQKELTTANWVTPPGVQGGFATSNVAFDDVVGCRYLYKQTAPVPMKRVEYHLAVPGGFVVVTLDALGADFDEVPFERQAHTLRLSASA